MVSSVDACFAYVWIECIDKVEILCLIILRF